MKIKVRYNIIYNAEGKRLYPETIIDHLPGEFTYCCSFTSKFTEQNLEGETLGSWKWYTKD